MRINFNFNISGFVIALIVISMVATGMGIFMSDLNDTYNLNGSNSLSKYNITQDIQEQAEKMKNSTSIKQETGWLDIIGGYFSGGYSALVTSLKSIDLFSSMMEDASQDVLALNIYKHYIIMIILIGLFIGVGLTVLLKWKV